MARIRSIKPEFWQDERLGTISRDARLLFLGLLNLADDFGILRGNPRLVKGHVFPFDDLDILPLLAELDRIGRIIRYRGNAEDLILVRRFTQHQRIDKREKQRFPLPPGYEVVEVPGTDAKGKPCLLRQVVEITADDVPTAIAVGIPPSTGGTPPLRRAISHVGTGSREQGAGKGAGRAPPPDAGGRLEGLLARLVQVFLEVNGQEYRGNGYDTGSLGSLIKFAPDAEIERRWRASLVAKYPRCATLQELAKNWDHFASKNPQATAPPTGAAGRRVGAEQTDWTGQNSEVAGEF